jgi:hypothetical protein
MLYCYFIARSQGQVETLSLPTLHSSAVDYVRCDDLMAAVRHLPAGSRLSPQLMLEHSSVLGAAAKLTTVLPLRFGTTFRSEAALVQLLAARAPELLGALQRLEGKAEMVLRVSLAEGEDGAARTASIAEICHPFDSRHELHKTLTAAEASPGPAVLEIAHLIDRGDADEYRRRVAGLGADVIGPRPPFHFLPQFLRMAVGSESRGAARAARRTG